VHPQDVIGAQLVKAVHLFRDIGVVDRPRLASGDKPACHIDSLFLDQVPECIACFAAVRDAPSIEVPTGVEGYLVLGGHSSSVEVSDSTLAQAEQGQPGDRNNYANGSKEPELFALYILLQAKKNRPILFPHNTRCQVLYRLSDIRYSTCVTFCTSAFLADPGQLKACPVPTIKRAKKSMLCTNY
jgi:hypothetical protein